MLDVIFWSLFSTLSPTKAWQNSSGTKFLKCLSRKYHILDIFVKTKRKWLVKYTFVSSLISYLLVISHYSVCNNKKTLKVISDFIMISIVMKIQVFFLLNQWTTGNYIGSLAKYFSFELWFYLVHFRCFDWKEIHNQFYALVKSL